MNRKNKGFTLIEMLVVIAIIAVLVSIVVPTVKQSTGKASAAADAANLRSIMGQLNATIATTGKMTADNAKDIPAPACQTFDSAKLLVVYQNPGFIDAYYLSGGNYYGLNYFAAIAETGAINPTISTAKPTGDGFQWYEAGVGAYSN